MATILVVDDQLEFRFLLEQVLQRAGYDVMTASDGAEAFQKVLHNRPDLILLDVMMPVVDGFGVLDTLKADPELSSVPIVMLTARDQARDLARGHRRGADVYLTKPLDRDELLLTVQRLLEPSKE